MCKKSRSEKDNPFSKERFNLLKQNHTAYTNKLKQKQKITNKKLVKLNDNKNINTKLHIEQPEINIKIKNIFPSSKF